MASARIKTLVGCSGSRLDQSQVRDLRRAGDPDQHPGSLRLEQVRGFPAPWPAYQASPRHKTSVVGRRKASRSRAQLHLPAMVVAGKHQIGITFGCCGKISGRWDSRTLLLPAPF
jgi:hypothetical protein